MTNNNEMYKLVPFVAQAMQQQILTRPWRRKNFDIKPTNFLWMRYSILALLVDIEALQYASRRVQAN
jgi:hypothetical protein